MAFQYTRNRDIMEGDANYDNWIVLMVRPKDWPKTVDEAVDQLISTMSEEDIETLRTTPEDDLILYHFSLGSYARNEFGLWDDNKELLQSCGSLKYPDSPYEEHLPMMVQVQPCSCNLWVGWMY